MIPGLFGKSRLFFWNIEANVGPGCPNLSEDVHLVQLAYACGALALSVPYSDSRVYLRVVPGASYDGAPNDPLSIAIRTHQQRRGGTQDGHVSPIAPSGTYDGKHTFMLISLNNFIRAAITNRNWPRIDQHPSCTALLRSAVFRSMQLD
jgi:hypothetical protein